MNKQVELLKAGFEDLQTIWKMQVEAFSELYEKYQDTDTSPATEKSTKSFGVSISPKPPIISSRQTAKRSA